MRTGMLVACLLPLLLAGTAACGKSDDGKQVASRGTTARPSATPSLSILDQGIRYAQCMRGQGIPWPDPLVDGDGVRLRGVDKGFDQALLDKAKAACKAYEVVIGPAEQDAKSAKSIEYSRCMRAHGVENFPDPAADGQVQVPRSVQDDPQYAQAKTACTEIVRSYEPSAGAKK